MRHINFIYAKVKVKTQSRAPLKLS